MLATTVQLECSALGQECVVLRARGTEQLDKLPRWQLQVLVPSAPESLPEVLGASALLHLIDEGEGSIRNIPLTVFGLSQLNDNAYAPGLRIDLELGSSLYRLSLIRGYRVFLDKTTQEIVQTLLTEAGLAQEALRWRLSGSYLPRIQCVQYNETLWGFVSRLLADEGISYWVDEHEQKECLVLGDSPESFDGLAGGSALRFQDPGQMLGDRVFYELEWTEELAPTSVHVRDYDVRHPDVYIEARAGQGLDEYFEYPACVLDKAAAERRAQLRLEQLRRHAKRAQGSSTSMRVQPGRLLDLQGASDAWLNQRYLVTQVQHEYERATPGQAETHAYGNRAELVPFKQPFRAPLPVRTTIGALDTATISGPSGEEIHVDDLAQLKIRWPWDRSGISDDKSSAWTRSLQMGMGASMLLPRVGWEVPVAYQDGLPERPVVLGRLYNGQAVVPYALPAGAATTTLQSATSPGGGTTNELRMSDTGGKQEMFLHASKDQTVTVGANSTTKVSVNATHDVGLSYGLLVKGPQSLTIGGSQQVDITNDAVTAVEGARSETVGGMESTKVTGNRQVAVKGAYSEVIGALYALQCNQANVDVKGTFAQTIGATLALGAGLGTSESVAGARAIRVGGSRTIVAAKAFGESVWGVKRITAGPARFEAGGAIVTSSSTSSGQISVGGSYKMQADGAAVIAAENITIKVSGSLNAEGLKMSGGTFKVDQGDTKLEGTIKRQGGTKIA